jgi:hypothetical protein
VALVEVVVGGGIALTMVGAWGRDRRAADRAALLELSLIGMYMANSLEAQRDRADRTLTTDEEAASMCRERLRAHEQLVVSGSGWSLRAAREMMQALEGALAGGRATTLPKEEFDKRIKRVRCARVELVAGRWWRRRRVRRHLTYEAHALQP